MNTTRMSNATAFPTRLTDEQWAILEPLVPANKPGDGRPAKYRRRDIVDAIVYVVRQGCTWRALPREFPHWNTVFWYYKEWQTDGTWDRLLAHVQTKSDAVGEGVWEVSSDGTVVRAHQHAAGAPKTGAPRRIRRRSGAAGAG